MKARASLAYTVVILLIVGLSINGSVLAQTETKAETKATPLRKITPEPSRIPCSAIIRDGFALSGDALGPYRDAESNSSVYQIGALSIVSWKYVDLLSNKPSPTAKAARQRSMVLDLSRPVEGSGAIRIQPSKDDLARFHVFWKYEEGPPGKSVDKQYFPREIPVGTTVESDRVEMWTRVEGVQHVLQMGPWAMGRYTPRSAIHGKGTTKATITRESESSWRIKAPDGSIARLWDYSDIQRPVDKGLYYFSFDVVFTRLD